MHAQDPSTTRLDGKYNGDFWFLIGGEKEKGESVAQTALREIFEETGLKENEIELGPVVWKGEFDLILSGKKRKMKQQFIVVKTSKKSVELTLRGVIAQVPNKNLSTDDDLLLVDPHRFESTWTESYLLQPY